jgi:hypothetical protein
MQPSERAISFVLLLLALLFNLTPAPLRAVRLSKAW